MCRNLKTMCLIVVTSVLFLAISNGFLFDDVTTPRPNSGSSLTDKHYFALVDMIMQEKQLRESYMLQIKQKILQNEHKASVLESKVDKLSSGNSTVVDKSEFGKATNDLMQKYQTLEGNYKNLQQDFIALKQNYAYIMDENNKLKRKINSSELEMNQMKHELNELKALTSINELQEIKSLKNDNAMAKQELQKTNTRINGLLSTQQARGQDFLALYNQTVDMKTKIQSVDTKIGQQNQTTQLFQEEVKKSNMEIQNKMQQIQDDHDKSVLEIQQSIFNISKETGRLENELNQHEQSTLHKIAEANTLITENSRKVAVTACATSGSYQKKVPISFPSIATSYGINNLSSLKSNGLFTCEHSGLYIVSVTIMSHTADGYFHVYKNTDYLVDVYLQSDNSNYHSGTAMVVVDMTVNDKISVKPFYDKSNINGNSDHQTSCLTVVKVK